MESQLDNILNTSVINDIAEKEANDFCFSTSLEFLLNKSIYKKINNNAISYQTIKENEERKKYMQKYNSELLELFSGLLNEPDNVIVSQEIHSIFESFVDKSVKYFIRTNQMLNPKSFSEIDDDDDDNDDDDDDDDDTTNTRQNNINITKINKYIFKSSTV